MEKSDEILQELTRLSNLLTACIEKVVMVRHMMLDTVVCEICQERIADSICKCGLNLCTTCELEHRHTNISP
jgi:hypothetical protein